MLQNLLEFDFDAEEGSGLGPTLEFYSLLAQEFKKDKELWRETEDFSFFPAPINPNDQESLNNEELLMKWKTIGAACGRAVLDQRVFDLRISHVFWKVILGKVSFYLPFYLPPRNALCMILESSTPI